MAAPNIASTAAQSFLRVSCGAIGTAAGTAATLIVSNGSASSAVLRLTRLDIVNIDGANACDITLTRFAGTATSGTAVCSTIAVPADAALRVLDDSGSLAVEEGQDIRAIASAAGDLTFDAEYIEFK